MIYPRLSAGFDMLLFFTNASLMVFRVRYLTLFCFFSVIEGPEWFWMGSVHKNVPLMMEFLKAPFLSLYLFFYTLMTFLMMSSVILLSVLMMLNSTLSYLEMKIKLNFYFHTSLWCLKKFYEGLKGLHKTFSDTKKCEIKNLT